MHSMNDVLLKSFVVTVFRKDKIACFNSQHCPPVRYIAEVTAEIYFIPSLFHLRFEASNI
jgi:hypothetical protein